MRLGFYKRLSTRTLPKGTGFNPSDFAVFCPEMSYVTCDYTVRVTVTQSDCSLWCPSVWAGGIDPHFLHQLLHCVYWRGSVSWKSFTPAAPLPHGFSNVNYISPLTSITKALSSTTAVFFLFVRGLFVFSPSRLCQTLDLTSWHAANPPPPHAMLVASQI